MIVDEKKLCPDCNTRPVFEVDGAWYLEQIVKIKPFYTKKDIVRIGIPLAIKMSKEADIEGSGLCKICYYWKEIAGREELIMYLDVFTDDVDKKKKINYLLVSIEDNPVLESVMKEAEQLGVKELFVKYMSSTIDDVMRLAQ